MPRGAIVVMGMVVVMGSGGGRAERAACRRYAIVVSPGLVTSEMLPTRGSDTPYLKRVVDTRLWYPQNPTDYFPVMPPFYYCNNVIIINIFAEYSPHISRNILPQNCYHNRVSTTRYPSFKIATPHSQYLRH